jgi:hypothetical protein
MQAIPGWFQAKTRYAKEYILIFNLKLKDLDAQFSIPQMHAFSANEICRAI